MVKKSKLTDLTDKNYNPKVSKVLDTIVDTDLTDDQIEEIKKRLSKRNMKSCSLDTGIAYQTILHIQRGATADPKPETIEKIVKWLRDN